MTALAAATWTLHPVWESPHCSPLLKRVFGRAKKSFSKKSVMLKLSINGVARDRKAQDNSYESPFSAELKVIIDKPAQVQTNKNDGGDINPNA